jgi:chromosomal replication initiator protein
MAVNPTPVLWERILDEVQRRLPTPQAFDTWFQPVRPRLITDAALELEVPSLFFAEWIQQHYFRPLADAACAVLGASPAIRFVIVPELAVVPPRR